LVLPGQEAEAQEGENAEEKDRERVQLVVLLHQRDDLKHNRAHRRCEEHVNLSPRKREINLPIQNLAGVHFQICLLHDELESDAEQGDAVEDEADQQEVHSVLIPAKS